MPVPWQACSILLFLILLVSYSSLAVQSDSATFTPRKEINNRHGPKEGTGPARKERSIESLLFKEGRRNFPSEVGVVSSMFMVRDTMEDWQSVWRVRPGSQGGSAVGGDGPAHAPDPPSSTKLANKHEPSENNDSVIIPLLHESFGDIFNENRTPVIGNEFFSEENSTSIEYEYVNDYLEDWDNGSSWRNCLNRNSSDVSELVLLGFEQAVATNNEMCGRFWCERVVRSERRVKGNATYWLVEITYVPDDHHLCLINISRMISLHHSWPTCFTDFVCATNDSEFAMSAMECMPDRCRASEITVLVFMCFVSVGILVMSLLIMVVIKMNPQFHKPKYYLRFSLALTDCLIGLLVCSHAAYNQWVSLSEVPGDRFTSYGNLEHSQLFRHVPNCLWGVSDIATQVSGFFVSCAVVVSLYTLAIMSLDRYLLLTCTNYRNVVTTRRVAAALTVAWACGLLESSLHFVYHPMVQKSNCVNYDTSPLDVHIINIESKIAMVDYKVYLTQIVPLVITLVVAGLPVFAMLVSSLRTLRKHAAYNRDHSVRQVKSALQLTQKHCSLTRQQSSASLGTFNNCTTNGTNSPSFNSRSRRSSSKYNISHIHVDQDRPYKLKYTFNLSQPGNPMLRRSATVRETTTTNSGRINNSPSIGLSENLEVYQEDGSMSNGFAGPHRIHRRSFSDHVVNKQNGSHETIGPSPSMQGLSGLSTPSASISLQGLRNYLSSRRRTQNPTEDTIASTIRKLRGLKGVAMQERDREITRTVLVNVFFFVVACFPLIGVGAWMLYLYFTCQEVINNSSPLRQLLFVAPWLMALNSLWNNVLQLIYNHKFRYAAKQMLIALWKRFKRVFVRREVRNPIE
ncbi:uncharacterized protein LOC143020783 [Oratosquilla oratoria]|uniref:uncharacterized protein LOC143020783 n=1 Tax=Oratosquilla oratoria TaxID=337810 RepID=UPI003F76EAAF